MVKKMWALINGERVAEITDIDPNGRFHKSFTWVPVVNSDVKAGWLYKNGEFSNDLAGHVVYVSSVSRAQGKASLIRAGLWQGVVDFVNSISDNVEKAVAEVALNDTTHWQRSSPFLNSAAQALGLTDEQLDQLFIDASKIEL